MRTCVCPRCGNQHGSGLPEGYHIIYLPGCSFPFIGKEAHGIVETLSDGTVLTRWFIDGHCVNTTSSARFVEWRWL